MYLHIVKLIIVCMFYCDLCMNGCSSFDYPMDYDYLTDVDNSSDDSLTNENPTDDDYFTDDYYSPDHRNSSIDENSSLFEERNYWRAGYIPLLNKRIFQGARVTIREHPYVASIRRKMAHFCVATVLSINVVITVAHPLHNAPIDELNVVAGENYADRGASLWNVILKIVHEDFNPRTLTADLALLRIYPSFVLKVSIKPIPIFPLKSSLQGLTAFVTGWGRCDFTGRELCLPRSSKYGGHEGYSDPMLRTVRFPINLQSNHCSVYTTNELVLGPGMLCLGPARELEHLAPCMAVPAAPLVSKGMLAGLLSWGYGCGYTNDLPLIYTDVSYYTPWLARNARILSSIPQSHFLGLFNATRAAILVKWLRLTRPNVTPSVRPPQTRISVLPIDKILAFINGTLYDIRDYLYKGAYSGYKNRLYGVLRNKIEYKRKIQNIYEDTWANKTMNESEAHITLQPVMLFETTQADQWNLNMTYDEEHYSD